MTRLAIVMVAGAALFPLSTAMAAPAAPKQVLAEVTGDFNGDGVKDRAVLLHDADSDDVDLAVYLSAGGKLAATPNLYKTAFGWTGDMAGTRPELSVSKAGSLVVVFQNDSVGRDRWRQQFTLAFRGGALVVAGYSYQARDTLEPKNGGGCDLNFLAGKGMRDGKPIKLTAAPIRVADWTDNAVPAACTFD